MARKMKIPMIAWLLGAIALLFVAFTVVPMATTPSCPGSQVYCPGVGCVSGVDKCVPMHRGGPSRVFSKETFEAWPGAGIRARPPKYEKETFVSKKCPDGTRTDGPCLMEF